MENRDILVPRMRISPGSEQAYIYALQHTISLEGNDKNNMSSEIMLHFYVLLHHNFILTVFLIHRRMEHRNYFNVKTIQCRESVHIRT